jgi:hypothetical protein
MLVVLVPIAIVPVVIVPVIVLLLIVPIVVAVVLSDRGSGDDQGGGRYCTE